MCIPATASGGTGRFIAQALVGDLHAENFKTIYLVVAYHGQPVCKETSFETETGYVFFKNLKYTANGAIPANITHNSKGLKDQIANLDHKA